MMLNCEAQTIECYTLVTKRLEAIEVTPPHFLVRIPKGLDYVLDTVTRNELGSDVT